MTQKEQNFNPDLLSKIGGKQQLEVDTLIEGLLAGNRTDLARAITAVENTTVHGQKIAETLIEKCLPHSVKSIRIGVTGVPGVGKSTLIESLGMDLIKQGKKIAVLAIDPSSQQSHGSILGDKTRMNLLSREENAFIRPSPAADTLGGVAQKTREAVILCEAAGFDIILIETVGVGQSEIAVHSMVDFFLLLKLAGAGDELQGIKRGIVEMADLIAINKCDGENESQAKNDAASFQNALHLYPPKANGWTVDVVCVSGLENIGMDDLWKKIEEFCTHTKSNGFFEENRKSQALYWLEKTIEDQLKDQFYANPTVQERIDDIRADVLSGKISPFQAARQLLKL